MVSFDVVGLFPNIPLEVAFESMESFLSNSTLPANEQKILLEMSKICMNQNQFKFRGNFYQQKSGVSIGNSASPMLSDFFMNHFEREIEKEVWFPRFWVRYVDGILAIVKRNMADEILRKLNEKYPTIQFTKEKQNGKIPFLDLKISRKENKEVEFEIYRKPIGADSFHHPSHKHAAFHSMIFRMFKIPMTKENSTRNGITSKRQPRLTDLIEKWSREFLESNKENVRCHKLLH
jgi:hypothetical protein